MTARAFLERIASNAMRRGLARRRAHAPLVAPERLPVFVEQHERLRDVARNLHRQGLTENECVAWLGMAAGLHGWAYTTGELRALAREASNG